MRTSFSAKDYIGWFLFCFLVAQSCQTTNQGKKVYKEGREQKGVTKLKCDSPPKTYAKSLEFAVKATFDSLYGMSKAEIEAKLDQKITTLAQYTSEGMDRAQFLYQMCLMINNTNMSASDAADLWKYSMDKWDSNEAIKESIRKLEKSEINRSQKENNLERIKSTPPKIQTALFSNNGKIAACLIIENDVPIKIDFRLTELGTSKTVGGFQLESLTVYPNPEKRRQLVDYTRILNYKPTTGDSLKIKYSVKYESIYYAETRDSRLRGAFYADYFIDRDKKEVVPLQ